MGRVDRFLFAILFAGLFACFQSCKQTEYVEVPTVRTEYVTKSDTVMSWDSVFVCNTDTVLIRGDSVIITKWRESKSSKGTYKSGKDTVLISDTISISVPIERDYSVWDKIRLNAFYPLVVVALLFVGFVVYKIRR